MARTLPFLPALATVVACYEPAPQGGAPCSADGRCPSPLVCVAGTCQEVSGPPDPLVTCPTGFVRTLFGACHVIVPQPLSWPSAELDCQQRGGHLVIPDSLAEAIALPAPSWIGLSDRVVEGSFRTVTGAPLLYQHWDIGEPSGDLEDCVYADDLGLWVNELCSLPFPYVCEYDARSADPSTF